MTAQQFKTREEWMQAFVEASRQKFLDEGYVVPDKLRVSCGFSSKGARSSRIGECWADSCSEDESFEIFIVPSMSDASRVADILTHEIIHAVVGLEAGHKKPFVDCMKKMGLEGKPTATIAGYRWHEWADPIIEKLGKYPHAALTGSTSSGPKKQTTRMVKCECDDCEMVFRTARKWIEDVSELRCPNPYCDGTVNVDA